MNKQEKKHRGRPGHALKDHQKGLLGLTEKRLRFIDEYMIDRNATEAARRAGYSATAAGQKGVECLRVQAIKDEIDRRTKERAKRVDITTDDVLRELKRIAFFDVRKIFDPKTGKFLTNPYEMDEEDARGLVNFDIVVLNKDGDYTVKLNPGNKMKALEMIGKNLKMFTDRVESEEKRTVKFSLDFGDEEVE